MNTHQTTLVSALCLAGLVLAARPAAAEEDARPNILFCFADDWGWPHAGAYGDKVVKTPTFDRLAKDGMLFEHAYISSPSCTPSRNAMLTGQQFYRLENGANLHSWLDVKHPNFVSLLREAGYETGSYRKAWGPGKWNEGGYEGNPCGEEASFTDFIAARDKSKPFCFWFGTSDPHRPFEPGAGKESGIPLDKIHVPAFFPDNDIIRGDIADYYYEVQRWDSDVKAAIELLDKEGLLENTIVVMTGDHGMPFPRCKGNLYDWGARVPLAIRWANGVKTPGRKVYDFVSLTDLAPTFLEAAGAKVPEQMTGNSLLSVLHSAECGRVDRQRDFMVFGRERHTPAQEIPSMVGYPSRAIRTDKWLLILNLEPDRWPAGVPENSSHPMGSFADCDNGPTKSSIQNDSDLKYYRLCFARRGAVELYDCEKDPAQVNNLAGDKAYKNTIDELRDRLTKYLKATGDPRFTAAPVKFDNYPYTAYYMKTRLEEYRKQQSAGGD